MDATTTVVFDRDLSFFDFDGTEICTGVVIYQLSCGHEIPSWDWVEPQFCPECGARIIKE